MSYFSIQQAVCTYFFQQICTYFISNKFHVLQNLLCSMVAMDDGGFLKAFFLINLIPSTSTHYLGLRLEIY